MSSPAPLAVSDFVGSWRLETWRISYPDAVTHPFGEDADGWLLYADDGLVSATMTRARRRRFGTADMREIGEAQKADAFAGYFNYVARWRIDGSSVVHDVVAALNPDLVATEQRREVEFDGAAPGSRPRVLSLSVVETIATGPRRHVLCWVRTERAFGDHNRR